MTQDVIDRVQLARGSHERIEDGCCVMELASYLAHEPFSDDPVCVSPSVGAFLRSWNDSLSDSDRQKLKPYALRVIGTRTTIADEERRAWMATDWLVREFTPAWLDLAGFSDHASALRSLPELTTNELANGAIEIIRAARSAAVSAAKSAAVSAAVSAAWSAAVSAAWSAAWSAARSAAESAAESAAKSAAVSAAESAAKSAAWSAAWSAAESAAKSAAVSAAWSAAESAARLALQPTVEQLQANAFGLLDRMITVGKEAA